MIVVENHKKNVLNVVNQMLELYKMKILLFKKYQKMIYKSKWIII